MADDQTPDLIHRIDTALSECDARQLPPLDLADAVHAAHELLEHARTLAPTSPVTVTVPTKHGATTVDRPRTRRWPRWFRRQT